MARELARRVFSEEDQRRFAELSGDYNPIHMDELAARRTQAGVRVVHGVNGALWLLDELVAHGVQIEAFRSVRAQFHRFIPVGREAAVRVTRDDPDIIIAEVTVAGSPVTAITLKRAGAARDIHETFVGLPVCGPDAAPSTPSLEEMQAASGRLPVAAGNLSAVGSLYPALCGVWGEARVIEVALLSTVVGMHCPGLHSLFGGLRLALTDDDSDADAGINWRVARFDNRFCMLTTDVQGSRVSGEVTAFVRAEPVPPPLFADISRLVAPDRFAGQKALIAGGSRGLGAVTALILAAGGASVILTYASGAVEAQAMVDAIRRERGESAAACLGFDAGRDPGDQLSSLPHDLTHLYYFASGKIALTGSTGFNLKTFTDLSAIHIEGFQRLALWLLRNRTAGALSAFYPSSTFVTERPAGLTEYAMVKAAAEVLVADLARATPGLDIVAPRLPRVLTDQTAAVPPVEAEDPVEVMMKVLSAGH